MPQSFFFFFTLHIPKGDRSCQLWEFFFFFAASMDCETHDSRAKNIIAQRVTFGESGPATGSYDGVPWLVTYHTETKGLWNHRKQNNQRAGAHSKKSSTAQKHNVIQDVAGCVWTSDESFSWASTVDCSRDTEGWGKWLKSDSIFDRPSSHFPAEGAENHKKKWVWAKFGWELTLITTSTLFDSDL